MGLKSPDKMFSTLTSMLLNKWGDAEKSSGSIESHTSGTFYLYGERAELNPVSSNSSLIRSLQANSTTGGHSLIFLFLD